MWVWRRLSLYPTLALVGKLMGKMVSKFYLLQWLEAGLRPLLGYIPHFIILVKGWLCFELKTQSDLELVMQVLVAWF